MYPQVVTFLNWFPGWPDGNYIDRGKYCWHVWVYKTGETGMVTEGANTPICFACSGLTSELQVLRLRGLCEASQFDRTYILAASGPEPLFYQGDRHTNLTYLADRGGWLLTSVRSNKGKTEPLLPPVTAFTEVVVSHLSPPYSSAQAPMASLVFGKHDFLFESDYNCR